MFRLFMRPVVGGPLGLSPGVRVDLFKVSFRSWGPLRGWAGGMGDWGAGEERVLFNLDGEVREEGLITGSPMRKPGRKPDWVGVCCGCC